MVAQISVDFPIFRRHAKERGRKFGAFAQTPGRTALHFIKTFIVPAANLVPTQIICKICWNKNNSKHLRGRKRNPRVEEVVQPILEK